jgi:tRNA G18 (ribose-2'-O)-methylase SpoU
MATVVEGGQEPQRGDGPIALLIGSEANGLPDDVMMAADEKLTLPMSGVVESINAGVAASILMYILTTRDR